MSDERLSPSTVRALNATFAPLSLRICKTCQGHPQPLDTEHFYWRKDRGAFEHECIVCFRARCAARAKARYHSDPAYKTRQNENSRRLEARYLERKRQSSRVWARRNRSRKLAALLARAELRSASVPRAEGGGHG